MSRFPREVRSAAIKCISCNAPVIRTVDDRFVCVECGEAPIRRSTDGADDEDDEFEFALEPAASDGASRQQKVDN